LWFSVLVAFYPSLPDRPLTSGFPTPIPRWLLEIENRRLRHRPLRALWWNTSERREEQAHSAVPLASRRFCCGVVVYQNRRQDAQEPVLCMRAQRRDSNYPVSFGPKVFDETKGPAYPPSRNSSPRPHGLGGTWQRPDVFTSLKSLALARHTTTNEAQMEAKYPAPALFEAAVGDRVLRCFVSAEKNSESPPVTSMIAPSGVLKNCLHNVRSPSKVVT